MPSPPPSSPLTNAPNDDQDKITYTHVPINRGKPPPFGALTGLYERLSHENKHELRRKLLANWFRKWREDVGPDLYPVLRLLLPQKDRERAVYNIKEKTLAKIYIRIIPLNMKDEDAVRLMNWKKPSDKDKTAGDFPMVLYDVISKRSNVMEGTLNVARVNNLLDELSKAGGKLEQQTNIMTIIYNNCTPAEQRWLVRVVLKDLNISVKETTVLSVFHEDAIALFNTCSDLKRVAYELADPTKRLDADDKTVKLFRAFAPMLCKRPTKRIEDTVKLMGGGKFIIEEKLDGERIQLHKQGNEYFYCSRKGKDYTYLYGKTVGEGSLTPYIDQAFDSRVTSIILDGEMLVWDPITERHLPFGSLKTAALDKSKKELRPRPCFKIFDLLYLNGMSLIDKKLTTRKKNMRAYVSETQGRLEYVREYEGKTAKEVRTRMDQIIEDRGEGLILKHPGGKYTLNGRNVDFIKVKPEYMDNMGETVDVLVVGGNFGSGKRGGGVSTLICAVRDDRQDDMDEDEPKYSSFVRIGSGLTFADYVWIRAKPWKPWIKEDPPSFFQTSKKGNEDKGDVYLEPEDSFVIKVKAAEIVPSDQYHINFTMRFPRALAIRDDLGVEDCLTVTALFEGIQSEKKRKTADEGPGTKRRKANTKKPTILPQYQGADVQGVEVQSKLFEGMRFLVVPDPKSQTAKKDKNKLEILIYAHGGDFTQLLRFDTSMIIFDGKLPTPTVTSAIKKGDMDIVKSAWLRDSINLGSLAPLEKRYFFHATDESREKEDYNADSGVESLGPPDEAEFDRDVTYPTNITEPTVILYDTNNEWVNVQDEDDSAPGDTSRQQPEEELFDYDSENDATQDDVSEPPDVADRDVFTQEEMDIPGRGKEAETSGIATENETMVQPHEDAIFKNLYFYLDTAESAKKNGMVTDEDHKYASEIYANFQQVRKDLVKYGGIIVDLDDPLLTHILYDRRDDSRRIQLMRRTSKPKRRYVIMTEWVGLTIENGALLDEASFS
ncbi:DNA ligase 4 [Hysterangium stoloniferum]|nr:DNA ligase 4 [Hysterangium stoloniferum]